MPYSRNYNVLSVLLNKTFPSCLIEQDVAHGAIGRHIDPSWTGPIELFLIPASTPRLV